MLQWVLRAQSRQTQPALPPSIGYLSLRREEDLPGDPLGTGIASTR